MFAFYDKKKKGRVVNIPYDMRDKNVPNYMRGSDWERNQLQGDKLDTVLAQLEESIGHDDDDSKSKSGGLDIFRIFSGHKTKTPLATKEEEEEALPATDQEEEEEEEEDVQEEVPQPQRSAQDIKKMSTAVNAMQTAVDKQRRQAPAAAGVNVRQRVADANAAAAQRLHEIQLQARGAAALATPKKTTKADAAQMQLNSVIRATQGEFHF